MLDIGDIGMIQGLEPAILFIDHLLADPDPQPIASYRESLAERIRVLFDRFHFFDTAIKVVGVGSVGTMCGVGCSSR